MLAGWCVAAPEQTSRSVGFELLGGSGRSEYLVVYGGLQFALGLLLLQPNWRPERLRVMLDACLMIHGCLVLARLGSMLTVGGIGTTTYGLAATEWVIFLGSVWFVRAAHRGGAA